MSDRKTTLPPHAPPTESTRGGLHHPTLHEIQTDSISSLAETYWTTKKPSERIWLAAIVEQIYCEELQNKRYETRKLMLLEFSQYLEKVYRTVLKLMVD